MRAMVVGVLLAALSTPAAAAEFVPPSLVTGAGTGGGPHVRGWDARGGSLPVSLMAYSGIVGGVRVATADVDGDGRAEIVAAPGEGGGSEVRVFDGRSYVQVDRLLPFGTWSTGVHVAGGDTDGDGKDEVAVGNGPGCCTAARFFSIRPPRELEGFHLYGTSSEVGARVALADFTGDGRAELAALPVRLNEGRVALYGRSSRGSPFRTLAAFAGELPTGLAAGDLVGDRRAEIVVAAVGAAGAAVRVLDAVSGATRLSFVPFLGFPVASVSVAVADVDGDGRADVIAAASTPDGLGVRAFDAAGARIASFFALDADLAAGGSLAAADLDGDRRAEIVLGSGPTTGEPRIAVFDGVGRRLGGFAYDEPFFSGGVRVALGDVVGGSGPEVVAAPGPGRPAEIRVFDPEYDYDGSLLRSFLPYGASFAGGLSVAAADTHGDRRAEIVVGPGEGIEPRVKVLDGAGNELASFLAFEAGYRGGVTVAAGDLDADGKAEIAVARVAEFGQVRLFEGSGEAMEAAASFATTALQIGIADTRGDGRAEVLVSEQRGGFEGIRLWDPWGDDGALLPSGGPGARLAAIDVDGDGRQEIVAASPWRDRIAILRGGRDVGGFFPYPWAIGLDVFVAAAVPTGPALAIDPRPFRAVVGRRLRPVVAVFSDAAGRSSAADFTATIDWGDFAGPARAAIESRGDGTFAVIGGWTYRTSGEATVEVVVSDRRGRTVETTRTIHVAAAPLRALAARPRAVPVGAGSRLLLGRIRDPEVAAEPWRFRVTVAWGDGTRSIGSLARRGGWVDVTGVHRYRRAGTYRILVRVAERGGTRTASFRTRVRVHSR